MMKVFVGVAVILLMAASSWAGDSSVEVTGPAKKAPTMMEAWLAYYQQMAGRRVNRPCPARPG